MNQPPPGLPAIKKKLILVVDGRQGKLAEAENYPCRMPKEGRVLIADVDQIPGKTVFETHDLETLEADVDSWFGKIFIPHMASNEEIFAVHPDRVIRRRMLQYAIQCKSKSDQVRALADRAQQVRHVIEVGNRFRDLAGEFHKPAILTFQERSGFSPKHVKKLLAHPQIVCDEEHVEMLLRLCRSL